MRFEWDPVKAASNKKKHGVAFYEAAECFRDPFAMLLDDPSYPERLILIGASEKRRVIFTVFAEREAAVIRIVSARRATANERRKYEEAEY